MPASIPNFNFQGYGLKGLGLRGSSIYGRAGIANGNKTCRRLFTRVIFKNFVGGAWISGVCRPKFTKRDVHCRETICLTSFFSELQYSAAFGRESRKFAGGVWKYAKFRHFLYHLQDIATWSKIAIFLPHLAVFSALQVVTPSEFRQYVWYS